MASKSTGFHPLDPDWTRGRAIAISQAEAVCRMQAGMKREVHLTQPDDPAPKIGGDT